MSNAWYVLNDNAIQGPVSSEELRKRLVDGKITLDTPIRTGAAGSWTLVRELPEFSILPAIPDPSDSVVFANPTPRDSISAELPSASDDGSVMLVSRRVQAAQARRRRTALFAFLPTILLAALAVAAFWRQLNGPRAARGWGKLATNAPANANLAAAGAVADIVPETPKETKPVTAGGGKLEKAADDDDPPPAKEETPVGTKKDSVAPKPAKVEVARVDKDVEAKPAAPRDSLEIPWPDSPGQAASGELEWEKLDTEVRSYKEESQKWDKKRREEQQLRIHLQKVATHLMDLDRRASGIANTMQRIRNIIGDDNAANAPVFAPPETPRYVQSLAKTFTLRSRDMSNLTTEAVHTIDEFDATLKNIDTNLTDQGDTLKEGGHLRDEWMRTTKLFAFWTHQDQPIPLETSTRWILNNPIFAPSYVARCITEIRQKSLGKAVEDIAVAIEKDPYWAELYALQAVLQDRVGKHPEAAQSLKNARRLAKKKQSAFFDVCEGIVFTRQHNFEGAKSKFRTAAKHDHTNSAGNAQLALLLVTHPKPELRDPAGAVTAATEACKISNWGSWWCLDVLAITYAAGGDFERAAGCIQRAKVAAPAEVQSLLDARIATLNRKEVPAASVGDL